VNELRRKRDRHLRKEDYSEALKYSILLLKYLVKKKQKITFDDWFRKGLCHFFLNQHEKAIECYTYALEIDRINFQAMVNKATSLLSVNRINDAFKLFREAFKINPNVGPAWYNIGNHFLEQASEISKSRTTWGESFDIIFDKAINAFRRAVKIVPNYAKNWVHNPFEDGFTKLELLLKDTKSVQDLTIEQILTQTVKEKVEPS
jgi:tetratricopeptide (TPR) repeat protein